MRIVCDKCGYEWDYKGKLKRPTCPSCKSTVNINLAPKRKELISEPEALINETLGLLGRASEHLLVLNHLNKNKVPDEIHQKLSDLRKDIKKIL